MQLIVITCADALAGEAEIINGLFAAGLTHLHLRKPHSTGTEVGKLLNHIDADYHNCIALHQHHELAMSYNINRLHYTEQARLQTKDEALIHQKGQGYRLSTSVHNLQSVPAHSAFDYLFFGPVFNSLSKSGYQTSIPSQFELSNKHPDSKLIALGGVDVSRITAIKRMHFDGVAVLGTLWNEPEKALETFTALRATLDVA